MEAAPITTVSGWIFPKTLPRNVFSGTLNNFEALRTETFSSLTALKALIKTVGE
ncbi:hypothetical protein DPMN_078323 [Dreissena polymorpha]|uniref:Uncharacterized protein n=1 Tax=Dreissena polymorpha TaxID=45954 RepID=A0A9D4BQE3_DREPO|nr:hypothetical protein DPMN_078323 [Dreissena polymorpha]